MMMMMMMMWKDIIISELFVGALIVADDSCRFVQL